MPSGEWFLINNVVTAIRMACEYEHEHRSHFVDKEAFSSMACEYEHCSHFVEAEALSIAHQQLSSAKNENGRDFAQAASSRYGTCTCTYVTVSCSTHALPVSGTVLGVHNTTTTAQYYLLQLANGTNFRTWNRQQRIFETIPVMPSQL